MSPVLLSLSKTRGKLCEMKTTCEIVWQESKHRLYTVAAAKGCEYRWADAVRYEWKDWGNNPQQQQSNNNRTLGTGKLNLGEELWRGTMGMDVIWPVEEDKTVHSEIALVGVEMCCCGN